MGYSLNEFYQGGEPEDLKSSFFIENLRGDTVDIYASWKIPRDTSLQVNIMSNPILSDSQLDAVKSAITSTESVEIDNAKLHKGPEGTTSTYYFGWIGAMKGITKDTKFFIPTNLVLVDSAKEVGDITIKFKKETSLDGKHGYTKLTADDNNNQILKAEITIFDINNRTPEELETIIRHEFGHALGLAHSSAPEDLMHETISTEVPYISPCDIRALTELYDSNEVTEITCKK